MNDYKHRIYNSVLSYGIVPCFRDDSQLRSLQGFSSLYAVTRDTAEAIVQAGTSAGFKGPVWSERLWIDLDSYERSEELEKKVEVLGYDTVVYDSGGKGFHVGILRDTRPSHLLPAQDKEWVKREFPGADTSIYSHLHLFRLPGTIHERTGRRKILLHQQRGSVLVHEPYAPARASLPAGDMGSSSGARSVFSNYQVMSQIKRVRVGGRHAALVTSCYGLRDSGCSVTAARWWLLELNKYFEEKKSEEEIEKILQDIFKG